MKNSRQERPALALRRAAMNMLARREHSFHELLAKLARKYPHFDPETQILPVVAQLRDESLQSDSRFAEAYVRYRSGRGNGPLKIAAELHPRQVDASLLEEVLYREGPEWEALCLEVLAKKFKPAGKPDAAEKQRWIRFLQQRGFTQEQINSALEKLSTAA